MKTKNLKIGELVRINKVPPKVTDSEIDTLKVFKQSLGKTFHVVGISEQGLLELEVTKKDTIWIEAEFVTRAKPKRKCST